MFLPLSAPGVNIQPFLPCLLFSTFLICYRQKQFETGDSRALLYNALCLKHKTGSFQTLEILWVDIYHSPPGKAKTNFSIGSQKCEWVSEVWQAAFESGLPCSIFFTHVLCGVAAQERKSVGGQVPLTSRPASAFQRLEVRVVKIHRTNVIGLMLASLKPAESQNCKPSQSARFKVIKKYKSSLK